VPDLSTGLPGRLTDRGLVLRRDLSFEEYVDAGRKLTALGRSVAWAIADWIHRGRYAGYGERYAEALAVTGLDYQTIANYAMVAGRFDISRRRENLSLQHHLEVASLPEEEQDAWLDRAEAGEWSRNELREQLRRRKEANAPRRLGFASRITLAPSEEERELWRVAAEREGLELDEWARSVLNERATTRLTPALAEAR
jgi:hypothetical protein